MAKPGLNRFLVSFSGIALFLLLGVAPLILLAVNSLLAAWNGSIPWDLAFLRGRVLSVFLQSLLFAGTTSILTISIAALLVSYGWRWSCHRLYGWRWLVAALALVPPVVHGFLWSSLGTVFNGALGLLGSSPWSAQGWVIALAAEVTWLLPVAWVVVSVSTASLDVHYVDAARLLRTDLDAVRYILIPFARPMLWAGAGLLFVMSMTDFTIPSLFQVNVFALEIFSEFSATHSPGNAFLLSLPGMLLCTGLLTFIVRTVASFPSRQSGAEWRIPPRWPGWLRGIQLGGATAFGSFLIFSVLTLWDDAGGVTGLASVFTAAAAELGYSLVVALFGASLGVLCACLLAQALFENPGPTWMTWPALFLPVAIPAPLAGIALVHFWNRPGFDWLYDSPFLPAAAGSMRVLPWAVILLLVMMRRTDPGLLEAAKLLSGSRLRRLFLVHLPLQAPGIVAAFALIFVYAVGELGATLLVLPPGKSTMTVRLYNYLHYGAAGSVAGLTLLAVIVSAGVGLLLVFALLFWGRFFSGSVTRHD